MTLPISQNSPVYSAPPTEEMLSKLIYVKWCVLVTYLCAIGLFVADADEPFGPLNDLFVACFGTFLLKEDPALAPCFRCLQETGLGVMSDGGLSCLLPYLLMASLNCAFGLLRVYTFATKYGSLLPCSQRPVCYLPVLVFFSSLSQCISCCRCKPWIIFKSRQFPVPPGHLCTTGGIPIRECAAHVALHGKDMRQANSFRSRAQCRSLAGRLQRTLFELGVSAFRFTSVGLAAIGIR